VHAASHSVSKAAPTLTAVTCGDCS
jgi:hypothetical protein